MSKVYIVTTDEYSDYHIVTAFTEQKDAEVYCAVHNGGRQDYGNHRVEEFEIGKIEYPKDVPIGYFFSYEQNGELLEYESFNFTAKIGKGCVVPNKVIKDDYGGYCIYRVGVMATSREQAEKKAQDLIAKFKAEQEGVTV